MFSDSRVDDTNKFYALRVLRCHGQTELRGSAVRAVELGFKNLGFRFSKLKDLKIGF